MVEIFSNLITDLDAQLLRYVGEKTALVAKAITPAATACAAIYVMGWGYLQMTGRIQEPILEGFKRIIVIALIFGIGLSLWLYNTLIVETFFVAPGKLAGAVVGSHDLANALNSIWAKGGSVAGTLWKRGGVFNGDIGFYLAGGSIYLLFIVTCGFITFLVVLSKIAMSITLVLGPLFIVLLFFDATKRLFEAWAAKLANYGLISVLTVLLSALLLHMLDSYASQTAALGSALTTVDTLDMMIVCLVVGLVFAQVPSIAAGLAGGVGLATFGAFSGAIDWALRGIRRTGYDFGRGVIDGARREPFGRYDSLRRGAGNLVGRGVASAYDKATGRNRTGGRLVPRERVWRSTTERKDKP
jgi:type IV secretion system protein VirB6